MLVLGVDAGGSKTVCQLADENGQVVAEARGPAAHLQTLGELEVEKVLHALIDEVLAARAERPGVICLGMAGVLRAVVEVRKPGALHPATAGVSVVRTASGTSRRDRCGH